MLKITFENITFGGPPVPTPTLTLSWFQFRQHLEPLNNQYHTNGVMYDVWNTTFIHDQVTLGECLWSKDCFKFPRCGEGWRTGGWKMMQTLGWLCDIWVPHTLRLTNIFLGEINWARCCWRIIISGVCLYVGSFSILPVIIPKKVFHLVSWLELLICSSYIFFRNFDIWQ